MRQQLIRQLRQGLGDESVREGRRAGPRPRRRPGRAGGHGRPLPRRTRPDGAVGCGASRPAPRPAACRQPRGARRADRRVRRRRRRSRTPRSDHLADELGCGGHAADRRADADQASRRAHRRRRRQGRAWSTGCSRARSTTHTLKLLRTAASQRWSAEADLVDGIEHIGPAGAAEARRGRRPGRRGRGSAVPLRSGARRRAAADRAAQRLHHPAGRPNRPAGQGRRRFAASTAPPRRC